MTRDRRRARAAKGLMDPHHYQLGFGSLWRHPAPPGLCIPVSRCPSLSLFSPSEPIMRELYSWQWQICGSLQHNANNRGYHVRWEDGTIFSPSFTICWGYPSFNHPGIFDWHCAAQREHQSEDNEELFFKFT